tara:strand:+ start:1432 stop:2223 length:792 start_codon:yes stop_codon:yes gene_type:complete
MCSISKNFGSLDLFESRNKSKRFKYKKRSRECSIQSGCRFNEVMGGSLRYLFDQASHTSHLVSPQVTGAINATTGTIGHGVSELYELSLPDSAKQYLAETYNNMMGEFPTENQRFLVQTTMGALVGQVTAKGLNLAVVNKAGNPRATSSLSSSTGALEVEKRLAIWTNKPETTTVQNAYTHYKQHGKSFSDIQNAKQYTETAKKFIESPPKGTLQYTRKNKEVMFYNEESNIFAVSTKIGTPKTMMKPRSGLKYFENKIKKDK